MMKENPYTTGGWNKMFVPKDLADHTLTAIPRRAIAYGYPPAVSTVRR
jgi:hypothetical protein